MCSLCSTKFFYEILAKQTKTALGDWNAMAGVCAVILDNLVAMPSVGQGLVDSCQMERRRLQKARLPAEAPDYRDSRQSSGYVLHGSIEHAQLESAYIRYSGRY